MDQEFGTSIPPTEVISEPPKKNNTVIIVLIVALFLYCAAACSLSLGEAFGCGITVMSCWELLTHKHLDCLDGVEAHHNLIAFSGKVRSRLQVKAEGLVRRSSNDQAADYSREMQFA